MTEQPLKVAVVGTNIGCLLHVRALRRANFEVTALVGRDATRAKARAEHFGIPHAGTSVDAVLDTDIDAIVIATPPATHHPFTMQAIAAGKHVMCEKPFSLDIAEAVEMRDAAVEAGLVGQIVHPNRWYAHRAALREVIQSGVLGIPQQASFGFDHFLLATGVADLPEWWYDNATGGGWLRNFNSHGIDLVRFYLGEFEAVSGSLHNDLEAGLKADDGYAFVFRLANGVQGSMTGTCRARDWWDQARVTGTEGTAGFRNLEAWLQDGQGRRDLEPSDEVRRSLLVDGDDPGLPMEPLPEVEGVYNTVHRSDHGYAEQVCLARSFYRRIVDPTYRNPSVATFDDGIAHMEVILAVEESAAKDGAWVDVSRRR
jgi:predicted dehydrogenase